jgi:hypothetical protein
MYSYTSVMGLGGSESRRICEETMNRIKQHYSAHSTNTHYYGQATSGFFPNHIPSYLTPDQIRDKDRIRELEKRIRELEERER